jgi:hypothetical protein
VRFQTSKGLGSKETIELGKSEGVQSVGFSGKKETSEEVLGRETPEAMTGGVLVGGEIKGSDTESGETTGVNPQVGGKTV